jgi:hypothetical protein
VAGQPGLEQLHADADDATRTSRPASTAYEVRRTTQGSLSGAAPRTHLESNSISTREASISWLVPWVRGRPRGAQDNIPKDASLVLKTLNWNCRRERDAERWGSSSPSGVFAWQTGHHAKGVTYLSGAAGMSLSASGTEKR